jgi:hypothetical protein
VEGRYRFAVEQSSILPGHFTARIVVCILALEVVPIVAGVAV